VQVALAQLAWLLRAAHGMVLSMKIVVQRKEVDKYTRKVIREYLFEQWGTVGLVFADFIDHEISQ
jgi:hypothetical protein